MSVLLDAGPALNFLAVGQQNLLIQIASQSGLDLQAPERIDKEVLGKVNDPRFQRTGVESTWKKLKFAGRLQILSDDITDPLFATAISRISGVPASQRVRTGKDLGEIMVMAHASVLVQAGVDVYVLMDEGDGRQIVKREQMWLTSKGAVGSLVLWSTRQVLEHAASQGWLPDGWQRVYNRMRQFDDGLPRL
ncbi:MAG: hypothetical protein WC005_03625 [Candidatus Nanopelagicales bacterium]